MSKADYTIECTTTEARFRGVMRLVSAVAYEQPLEPVRSALMAASAPYTLDLRELVFMNSSGIRALLTLIIDARSHEKPIILMIDSSSPWQKKTASSLKRIHPHVAVRHS